MKADIANRFADPENLHIPGFKEILKKKNLVEKKYSRQVAAILIISGKLKI